jgi:putative ABC transport system substrate-binding protein
VITRRTALVALAAAAAISPFAGLAQQQNKVWRVGFFYFGSRQSAVESGRYGAFIQGMHDVGYVEGKNILIEARFGDGQVERLAGLAAELVQMKVDVIVATGTAAYRALRQATVSTPIVVTVTADPMIEGYAMSMAKPGGNITGLSDSASDMAPKLVELLRTALPKLSRVGVLLQPRNATHPTQLKSILLTAQKIGAQVSLAEAATAEEIEAGLAFLARARAEAVIFFNDTFFFQELDRIAAQALKYKMPSICAIREYAAAGGLMGYGPDLIENFRRAASFVDRILKGAKPGDLPFEQPTRYYLMINRKSAKALSVTIPQSLLLRADKVIG